MCKKQDVACKNIADCDFIPERCRVLLIENEKREIGADGNTVNACKLMRNILENSGFLRSDKARNDLKRATLLRDIGKIGIPEEILNSPEVFNDADPRWSEIRNHPEKSVSLIKEEDEISPELLNIIRYHHPWYYESAGGYLIDSEWDEVTVSYLIISVVDAYIGLRSKRARRKEPLDHEQAIEIIKKYLDRRKYKPSFTLVLIKQLERIHPKFFEEAVSS